MSLVKSRHGRTTEKRLRAHFVRRGLAGWTMNEANMPGKPDFVFRRVRVAVFVDGCFWHGCSRCKRPPKSNVVFWENKVLVNQRRDRRVASALRRSGWKVIRVRECELKDVVLRKNLIDRIEGVVKGTRQRKLLK
jgi:DNA mismatch endonuclease (patch repair protein)